MRGGWKAGVAGSQARDAHDDDTNSKFRQRQRRPQGSNKLFTTLWYFLQPDGTFYN